MSPPSSEWAFLEEFGSHAPEEWPRRGTKLKIAYDRTYVRVFCGKFKQVVDKKLGVITRYLQQIVLLIRIKLLESQKNDFQRAYLHIDLVVVCSFQVTHIII